MNFLEMGGYGLYIWGSYASAAVILGLNFWLPWLRHRRLLQQLEDAALTEVVHAPDS